VTVKQLFETYVYAQILSSVDLLPFVIGSEKNRAQEIPHSAGLRYA